MADRTYGTSQLTYGGDAETPLLRVLQNTLNTANNNLADAALDNVLTIDAGMLVMLAGMSVVTAEGATQTFDLGDGDDADFYLAEVDGNATAGTVYMGLTLGIPAMKMYSAADTLDVTAHGAAGVGVYKVRAAVATLFP